MADIRTLKELFIEQAREQYNGEKQQYEELPKIRSFTTYEDLMGVIDKHVGKTQAQLERLKQVFDQLGVSPEGERNRAVEGLIQEAHEILNRSEDPEVRNAGIVTSVQHLNHHNIASYGTLHTYAEELELGDIASIFSQSLTEERNTDKELTALAEYTVNIFAIKPKHLAE